MVASMSVNWKTSALGICGLLTALGSLGSDVLSGNFATVAIHLPAIAASLGLLFAKDSTTTK